MPRALMPVWVRANIWWLRRTNRTARSCCWLSPVIAVITNIDADHLENYGGDFAQVRKAFNDFLHRLPFYGLAVLCVDDEEVADLGQRSTVSSCDDLWHRYDGCRRARESMSFNTDSKRISI